MVTRGPRRSPERQDNQNGHPGQGTGHQGVEVRTVVWKQGPTDINHGVQHRGSKDALSRPVVNPDDQNAQGNGVKNLPQNPACSIARLYVGNAMPYGPDNPQDERSFYRSEPFFQGVEGISRPPQLLAKAANK